MITHEMTRAISTAVFALVVAASTGIDVPTQVYDLPRAIAATAWRGRGP
jgi:hypothetical protein